MKTKTISFRKIMILSFFLLATMLTLYIVLMSLFVSNTKTLSTIDSDIISIQTEIAVMEQELITKRKTINRAHALEQGYGPVAEISYVKIDTVKTAFLNE